MRNQRLAIRLAAFLCLAATTHASVILSLDPTSGGISGTTGSTIGWGFTLDSATDFAVITSSDFCLGSSGVTSLCVAPTLGDYTDFIAGNFTIAGPVPESPVVTQAFNAVNATGVGSFQIDTNAALGATDTGQIVATYDLYSADPNAANFEPITDLISAGNFLAAPASISVTAAPEPSHLAPVMALALLCLVTTAIWQRRGKRRP
jgi:hypothetical protein